MFHIKKNIFWSEQSFQSNLECQTRNKLKHLDHMILIFKEINLESYEVIIFLLENDFSVSRWGSQDHFEERWNDFPRCLVLI